MGNGVFIAWMALIAVVGCGSPHPEALGKHQQSIYDANDGRVTEDNHAHPQVFAVKGPNVLDCTGSLVAPDVVLTAGHCTAVNPALGATYVTRTGTYVVEVAFNAEPSLAYDLQQAVTPSWEAHEADVIPLPSLANGVISLSNDLALIHMPTAVPRTLHHSGSLSTINPSMSMSKAPAFRAMAVR